jgi:hypothetical protein
LRQNSRDGKPADEELLGSAIQACWELCDLFREGWSQVRPDRGTPRPSQYAFSSSHSSVSRSNIAYSERSGRSSSVNDSYHSAIASRMQTPMQPETPTTIFDDREEFSPAEEPNVPNILVLGPEAGMTRTHDRWSLHLLRRLRPHLLHCHRRPRRPQSHPSKRPDNQSRHANRLQPANPPPRFLARPAFQQLRNHPLAKSALRQLQETSSYGSDAKNCPQPTTSQADGTRDRAQCAVACAE